MGGTHLTDIAKRYIVIEPVSPSLPDGECNVLFVVEQQSFHIMRESAESREHAEWFATMFAAALAKVIGA